MDPQTSEPTTISTDVYGSDGSAIVKQEPQNDYPQMESSSEVINIAPIINNQTKICKILEVHSIKQESYNQWYEFSKNSYPPVMKAENDLKVCDSNKSLKLFNKDLSVKTEIIQTDDTSSPLMEVSGAIDCKDEIINDVTAGMRVGRVNQTHKEQSDATQLQTFYDPESTDETQAKGMSFD